MLYVFVVFIPLVILLLGYVFSAAKPNSFPSYIKLIVKVLPYLFCYGLLLYFLEMENYIDTGWVFYSYTFFMLPVAIIALLLNLLYWVKNKKN